MNAKNQIIQLTAKLQKAERSLASEAAKVAELRDALKQIMVILAKYIPSDLLKKIITELEAK